MILWSGKKNLISGDIRLEHTTFEHKKIRSNNQNVMKLSNLLCHQKPPMLVENYSKMTAQNQKNTQL